MTEPVVPYQVDYSKRVLQRLVELGAEAWQRGDGARFAAALQEFHRRLCIYPQFGHPVFDLVAESGQIYNGIIRPLAMRYGVLENRRLVIVGALPILLPMDSPGGETEEP